MKHKMLFSLVESEYTNSSQDFAQWMWRNHVPLVAQYAEELSKVHGADVDLAVAGALLHDFGDVFVHRHDSSHTEVSRQQAVTILKKAEFSDTEITSVLNDIVVPHSCKDGNLPQTIEAKVLATADAMAHLGTDFYLQFSWMHLPEGKTYSEFISWVQEKLDRDFSKKIFFEEVKLQLESRYLALKEVFREI